MIRQKIKIDEAAFKIVQSLVPEDLEQYLALVTLCEKFEIDVNEVEFLCLSEEQLEEAIQYFNEYTWLDDSELLKELKTRKEDSQQTYEG